MGERKTNRKKTSPRGHLCIYFFLFLLFKLKGNTSTKEGKTHIGTYFLEFMVKTVFFFVFSAPVNWLPQSRAPSSPRSSMVPILRGGLVTGDGAWGSEGTALPLEQ